MTTALVVSIGTDDIVRRELTIAGAALSPEQEAAITDVRLQIGELTLSEQASTITRDGGVISINLGQHITRVGQYLAYLSVCDAEHPEGIPWDTWWIRARYWPTQS